MRRRYVFRADASPEMGTGHVMRLCSIIEEMLERKKEVLLVGSIVGIPWLEKRIETLGNKVKFLRENDFLSDPSRDVLVIDSYTLDPNSKFLANQKWHKIVALVEVGTPKYKADLYIHCGTNSKIELEFQFNDSKFISGVKYLPIRKSIQRIKYKLIKSEEFLPVRILVVGGGTDPLDFVFNLSLQLLELKQQFQAVIISNKIDILESLDSRFAQISIGENLDKELLKTDLILSLAGTSSWEFLSSGFPMGIALGFDNQRDNFNFQKENGMAFDVGFFEKGQGFEFNKKNLLEIIENKELRAKLSSKAISSIDGLGAIRIADKLIKLSTN